jgi:hypothetical protein
MNDNADNADNTQLKTNVNIITEGDNVNDAISTTATAESTEIKVSKLNIEENDYSKLNKTNVYKAIAPNGSEYIVFKGTTGEFSNLQGGKKSRKSKTHKQKKVHRSTQKRNGRKKTNNRRK